jgi:hypothetical protein
MFKKGDKSNSTTKKPLTKKAKKISYDEHFTRATASIDLMKNSKFTDIGDGISKRETSEFDKLTQ